MKNVQAGSSVSTLQVLEVLSDRISVDIFNAIAQKVTTSDSKIARPHSQAVLYETFVSLKNRLNQTKT